MNEYEFEQILSLVPIVVISIMVGLASYFTKSNENIENENSSGKPYKVFFKQMVFSITICIMVYSILSATDLPYLAKIGISSAIAFFGIEQALNIVQTIISLKNGNKDTKDKTKGGKDEKDV